MHDVTRVSRVAPGTELLEQVKKLWRSNSRTLGFFPDGAFDEHAGAGKILVASRSERLAGFLTYREARGRAAIVHLCVAPAFRGRGVARTLVERMREHIGPEVAGILVRCRRDFPASAIWPRLGFVPIHREHGRGKEKTSVDVWWQDFRRPDLFSALLTERFASTVPAVIDTQVFLDLALSGRPHGQQAKALAADWIAGELSIWLTDEILVEIDRDRNESRRKELRKAVSQYPRLSDKPENFQIALSEVRSVLAASSSERSESDLRHIARAIAANAPLFITRDQAILDAAERLYERFGLSVVHPLHAIARVEELADEARSKPGRLSGTLLRVAKAQVSDIDQLVRAFVNTERGEKKGALLARARHVATHRSQFGCRAVYEVDGSPIAMLGMDSRQAIAHVRVLRIRNHPLGSTLTRHLLWRAVQDAASAACKAIEFEDEVTPSTEAALLESGYFRMRDGRWVKLLFAGLQPAEAIHEGLTELGRAYPAIREHTDKVGQALGNL